MTRDRVLVTIHLGLVFLFVLMVVGIRCSGIGYESSVINVSGADSVFVGDLVGNDSAVGGGSGGWYPLVPPVSYVSYSPDYLVQWTLSEWNEAGS